MSTLQHLLNQVKTLERKGHRDQVIELLPDSVLTAYNNHELYSASAHAWGAKGDQARAIRDFSRAIGLAPHISEYHSNRGVCYMHLKDYAKAIDNFTKAIACKPGDAIAHFNRGEALKASDKNEEAQKDYNTAIKNKPDLAIAYLGRGNLFYLEHEYDKAIRDFDKAISLDPTYTLAWHYRGNAWAKKQKYSRAVEDFTKAISLDPDYADNFCERGWAFYASKLYEKALSDFETTIAIESSFDMAYYGIAEVWYAKNEFGKAVEYYTKFIELRPYDVLGYNNRGYAWRGLKEYDKAIEDFTISIGLNPTSASDYFSRGISQSDKLQANNGTKKDFDMAIKDFDEAIRLNPSRGDAYCERGILWCLIQEYSKARKDLEIALQLDPGDTVAKRWLEVTNKQNSSELPMSDLDKQAIREQAAAFIDQIRHHLSAKCKIEKGKFVFGWYVSEWDEENQRPLAAGVQSWLPEIRPDIAKWATMNDIYGKPQIGVCTLNDEEFWPSLAGIPIKKDLWRAITMVRMQYRIGEKMIHVVKDFAILNRLLERIVVRIRSGEFDHHIVFGEYRLPTVSEEFEAALKRIATTPYTPPPKKKK